MLGGVLLCVAGAAYFDFQDYRAFHTQQRATLNSPEEGQYSEVMLRAQQEIALWTYGGFLSSLFALASSVGGLVALVWTFRETRKLTQSQQRAVLEIEGGAIWFLMRHSTPHAHVEVALINNGKSHAKNIALRGKLKFFPDHGEDGLPQGAFVSEDVAASCRRIAPGQIDVVAQLEPTDIPADGMYDRRFGSGGPHIGMGKDSPAEIIFCGEIQYEDEFGTRESLNFEFHYYTLESGVPNHSGNGHRHWRASAYEELRWEAEERMRKRVSKDRIPSSNIAT